MKNILLLLNSGFEIYEAGVFIDIIGWNLTEGDGNTKLHTCGAKKEVKSAFGPIFKVDYLIAEIDPANFDALAVPGGFEEFGFYEEAYKDEVSNLIKAFYNQGKIIASVCTGALPVAKSGVLKNKKATTYNKNPIREESLRKMGAILIDNPVVEDGNIISGQNPAAAITVAFCLLEKLTGKENTNKIKIKMGFE